MSAETETAAGGRRTLAERWRALRLAWRLFRPALEGQGPRVASSLLLSVLVAALELLKPWPIKLVFDRVLMPPSGPRGPWGLSPLATLAVAAAVTVLISVLLGNVALRSALATAEVSKKVTTRIRRRVFEHLHRLALPFHQASRGGDLLMRVMTDVNAVRDAVFASWIAFTTRGLLFLGTTAVMLALEPWLALVALWPVPLLSAELTASARKLRAAAGDQRRHEGEAAAVAAETLRQIGLVKAYAAEEQSGDRFSGASTAGESQGYLAARISARQDRTIEILSGLGLALVLLVGANWVLSERISAGTLVVFASYTRALYKPLRKAGTESARLSRSSASAVRLLEILRTTPEDFAAGEDPPPFKGEIEARDLVYVHPDGPEALRGASFRVQAGDLVLLVGPNGSGKSTLLSVLLRLVSPDRGEALIDGLPISRWRLDAYRRNFAYVPQQPQLFGASLRDNVLYGRPDASPEDVEEAARLALLEPVVAELPAGYDTMLGEDGATLSGGQARRLMLARAALRDARIVLLDEPLAGLDPEARAVVSRAIRRVADGRTAVVVSHGPAEELDPDVVVRMEGGVVASVDRAGVAS